MRCLGSGIRLCSTLAAVTLLVSCASRHAHTLAVIPRTTGMSLWESAHAGAEAAASNSHLKIYWNAPTREDDVKGQIALVNRAIDGKYAGLILAPDQSLALMTPVRRGLARGIPTVVLGSPLAMPPGGQLSYVLSDEDQAGALAADRIGEILRGKGSIVIVGINFDIIGVVNRVRAFEASLAARFPSIKIVEKRSGSFNVPYEQQTTEELLMAHPGIDAVVAVTSDATRGAYAALDELHRLRKVKLVGFDQDLMLPIATEDMDSVIVEDTYDMGLRAVQLLSDELQGKPVPTLVKVNPRLVTRENLNSAETRRILALDSGWYQ